MLVDADLQFGDIVTALGLEPERTIVDAVADAAADEIVFKTSLTHHDDGFFVVASAPSPELGDSISTAALGQLIERLRRTFRYVIVDTTPGLGEHTLVALEHVTDAVFVTNMGVPSLRAMRTEFELLTAIGLMPANRHIVLNQVDKLSGLTVRDAETHHRRSHRRRGASVVSGAAGEQPRHPAHPRRRARPRGEGDPRTRPAHRT